MNKRLLLHSADKALALLNVTERDFPIVPRFEIAPTQFVGAIWTPEGALASERAFSGFRWGFTPRWWDESNAGHRLFAARAETLASKPAFAEALKSRRALVPVDGFWVWNEVDGENRPFLVRAKTQEPLFVAAIWDEVRNERGALEKRLAMVSVESNRLLEPFGTRMPAILKGADCDLWLESNVVGSKPLLRALKTPPAREFVICATEIEAQGWESLREAKDGRDALNWVYGAHFSPEKPRFPTKRRQVLRDHEAGGHLFFRTRSFTRDDATRWHPVIDLEAGHVFCDCPDFRYRHAHFEPDIWTPQWWCKHIARAVGNCRRHGELPAKPLSSILG